MAYADVQLAIALLAIGFFAGYALRGQQISDDRDVVEQFLAERRAELQQRYETTRMDYVEFGDRIAVLEDPGTERIMRDAIEVDGIGPEIAFEIARTFGGDYEAYRSADRDALERVNGVGENRATALLHT